MTKKRYNIVFCALLAALFLAPFCYFCIVYYQSYAIIQKGRVYLPNIATQIYDCNNVLISELFDENRDMASIDEIPPVVKQAFIAAEDQNFYKHAGIDPMGIMRAIVVDITRGEIKQGGSTITQQLVKQLYTTGEKTLRRKIIELLITREFEDRYSKDEILKMYLNQIYFGHGVYGVKAAARFYFNTPVTDLNLIQASILAAIPAAPNRYSPLRNPAAAYERNRQILYTLIDMGIISRDQAIGAYQEFWPKYAEDLRTRSPRETIRNRLYDRAPHFTEYIRRLLVEKYGEERVYRGGLRVYTTLDLRQQAIAEKAVTETVERQDAIAFGANSYKIKNLDAILLKKLKTKSKPDQRQRREQGAFLEKFRKELLDQTELFAGLFGQQGISAVCEHYEEQFDELYRTTRVEGALVALDVNTGAVTALVGGRSFDRKNQLNRAIQAQRQPGSAFKPFVYAAGIESRKITAASGFRDTPDAFNEVRRSWKPTNYGKKYKGMVQVRKALALSINTVSVHVYDRVGGPTVAQFAARLMNLPADRFEVDPTLALGTSELSPLEMARGMAVFANGGVSVHPYAIRHINDQNGKRIFDGVDARHKARPRRLITPALAYIITNLLRDVVDRGTAAGAVRGAVGFAKPAAGKTGTNTAFRDAWFVGYTPDLVASVWVGCDSPKFTLGSGQSGAVVAAPVWAKFMAGVYQQKSFHRFPPAPSGVRFASVCSHSGLLPGHGCAARRECFLTGTVPAEVCDSVHDDGGYTSGRSGLTEEEYMKAKLEKFDEEI